MGWLGKIISKVKNTKYADVMTGQVPIFSQFGRDIYVSDVVQQAIECIANEMSKLFVALEMIIRRRRTTFIKSKTFWTIRIQL